MNTIKSIPSKVECSESCIMFLLTCWGEYNPLISAHLIWSFLTALWIVIMRFQQVRDFNCASRVNTVSLVLGFISSIGISILGNFQQTVVMGAHLLGAFLAFFVGLAYFWVQVWLTYRAKPSDDKKWAGPARIIFCSLCTCLVLLMSVFHNIGYRSEAAMCEWALVMCFFMLFGIFSAEFRHIDFHQLHVQNEGLNKSTLESPAQHNK
ncbi:hypothetical protein HF521_004508 [Silurus meridionalis]|uniref:CWH43-like N-terminal domain-containing protein n=1 Tax=Silurus meridionalis TaxID=175797 RepID=A0A8T0AZZ3_SILME|nr:hypothetical protein HF521_004508 [Silurus meridionalis]